jgi:hypothetical protein
MIENAAPRENGTLSYHFDIAQYHTNLTALINKNHWKYAFNISYDTTKSFGGFLTSVAYRPIVRRTNIKITEEIPLPDDLDLIYRELIDYCKKLDADVLFVIAPALNRDNAENFKKQNYMRRVADENGISFINFIDMFDEIGLDAETDYYSRDNLNIFGVKKYTKWFGEYLKNKYDLPDRRNNGRYADWDIAYEQWIAEASEIEQAVFALMPERIQAKIIEASLFTT